MVENDPIPTEENYFLSIVAIFKGENHYLLEWLEFHRLMGVEHFFLYDNGLEESSADLLAPYVQKGIVTHVQFPHRPGLKDKSNKIGTLTLQQLAYGDCLIRFRRHLQYLIQLDIDEFIFPISQEMDSVKGVLQTLNKAHIKGIETDWKIFGSNNHDSRPPGLVTENYTKTTNQLTDLKLTNVKSIGNVDFISTKYQFSNVHRFIYRFSIIDIFKRLFIGYPRVVHEKNADQLFQLNHYKMKSKEDYLNKRVVYSESWLADHNFEQEFENYNSKLNDIEDHNILRFIPELKSRLTKLRGTSSGPYLPQID
jgi:hypothetical protein